MRFIIVCVDKENPEESEIVPVEPTEKEKAMGKDLENGQPAHLFPTKENAVRWTKADEREFPGAFDYHIIEVP